MGSARIKGNKLPILTLGSPGAEYAADFLSAVITNEEADSDVITFEDAANGGGRQYFLNFTAIQSTAATSFWTYTWDNTGDEVAATYAPHGNAVATVAEPHFVFVVKVGPKPDIGGEASTSASSAFTFEGQWEIVGDVTKDTGA